MSERKTSLNEKGSSALNAGRSRASRSTIMLEKVRLEAWEASKLGVLLLSSSEESGFLRR